MTTDTADTRGGDYFVEMLPCGNCNRLFRTSFGLLSHRKDFHHLLDENFNNLESATDKNHYKCLHCNRILSNAIGLLAHQRDTHGEEPQFCLPVAEIKTATTGGNLISSDKNIRLSRATPLSHPCAHCRRSFRSLLDLRAHEKDSHSMVLVDTSDPSCTNDAIPCGLCRRVFQTVFGLYTHQRDAHGLTPQEITVFPDVIDIFLA